MHHILLRIFAVTCVVLAGSAARALDAAQVAAIDRLAAAAPSAKSKAAVMASHYAVLLWVEDYCNGRSDEAVRTHIQKQGEGDKDAFEDAWADAVGLLTKTDPVAMCALALQQYGPDGALIKGAWAPKS